MDTLRKHLDSPLDPEEKIPISGTNWQNLLYTYSEPKLSCQPEDLNRLFILNENEFARIMWPRVYNAISKAPPSDAGTEDSFHTFWDENIRDILIPSLGEVPSIRNSNQGTFTGNLRPDLGLFLGGNCIFRGEEKRPGDSMGHPGAELADKTRWFYDPAPFILGARLFSPAELGIDLSTFRILRYWRQYNHRGYL